jgi:hypothetical protein
MNGSEGGGTLTYLRPKSINDAICSLWPIQWETNGVGQCKRADCRCENGLAEAFIVHVHESSVGAGSFRESIEL